MPFATINWLTSPPVIHVATAWNEKELITQVPGAHWDTKVTGGRWTTPFTWAAAAALRGVFGPGLSMSDDLIQALWDLRNRCIDPAMLWRDKLTADANDTNGIDPRLFLFQRAWLMFADYAQYGVLGDEMGCGKTIELLAMIQRNHVAGKPALPALIVCPNTLKEHWGDRVKKWAPGARAFVIDGTAAQRRKLLLEARAVPNALVIINIEAVRSFSRLAPYGSIRLKRCTDCDRYGDPDITASQCEVHHKELNDFGFKTVILDEAHRIKDPKAKQTRAIWAVFHAASVVSRWAATGTLIAEHIGDAWSILHAVAPHEYPVKSKFIDRYALVSWNGFGGLDIVGIKPETRAEFFTFFAPHYRRMLKSLVLKDLPPKVYSTRYVDMSAGQKRMYKQLSESLFAMSDDGETLVAPNQLTAQTRLSQLALASVKIETHGNPDEPSAWDVTLREPSPKIDELMQIVEELGDERAVVAAEHKQIIDLASTRLTKAGVPHLLITGDVAPVDRQRALQALSDGHVKLVLFTTKAGGVGLDMSAASTFIWLQHPWSMIEYLQAEDRVHRIGSEQHASINVISIVTRGTIEESRLVKLAEKLERLEEIQRDREARLTAGLELDELDAELARIMNANLIGDSE